MAEVEKQAVVSASGVHVEMGAINPEEPTTPLIPAPNSLPTYRFFLIIFGYARHAH
jgi:hypothetical protein